MGQISLAGGTLFTQEVQIYFPNFLQFKHFLGKIRSIIFICGTILFKGRKTQKTI